MNIRNKTLFWFLLPSVLIATFAATFSYISTIKTVKENIFSQLEIAADELRENVYNLLQEKKGRTLDFSSDGFIRDCAEEITSRESRREHYTSALNNHLTTNKKSLDPNILEVFVVDFDGKIISSTDKRMIGGDISAESYFKEVEFMNAFASGPEYDSSLQAFVIDFSTVLLSKVGQEALGVMVNRIKFEQKDNENQVTTVLQENDKENLDYIKLMAVNKARVIDFSSDGFIRDCAEEIIRREDRTHYYTDLLNTHLILNKKPLDPEVVAVFVVDFAGMIVASSEFAIMGRDVSNEAYFVETMKRGSCVSRLYKPEGLKYSVFEVARLLLDKKGQKHIGVIVNRYSGDSLARITRHGMSGPGNGKQIKGMGETGEVYIVNNDKLMITESRFIENAIFRQVVDTEGVRAAYENSVGMVGLYPDYRGVPILGVSRYMEDMDWVILAEKDVTEAFAPIVRIRNFTILMGVAGVIVIVAVAIILSTSITRPIKTLTEGTKRIASGDLENPIMLGNRQDEIKELGESFNLMITNLNESKEKNKKLFMQVKKGRDEWKKTFDAITDIITIHDEELRIVMANKVFFEKFKVDKKQLSNIKCCDVFHDTQRGRDTCPIERSQASLQLVREEMVYPNINGDFLVSVYPLKDDAGKVHGFVHLAKDVSFQKKIQKQLIDKASKLEKVNKEMEDFVYIVSHDLKEPLFSIEGFRSRLFKRHKDVFEEKDKMYLERIRVNVENMSKKIYEIMEVLKLGRIKYDFKSYNSKAIVNDVVRTLENKITQNNINIINQNNLPTELMCDKERLKAVFLNLISNAIKYMGDEEQRDIKIGCDKSGDYYKFYIEDTGIGINAEYQEQVFRIFRRLKDVEVEGTGVGLAIVKKIVEVHEGKIWVESPIREEKGSRFCFTMPAKREILEYRDNQSDG